MVGRMVIARLSRRLPMKHQGQTVSEMKSICIALVRNEEGQDYLRIWVVISLMAETARTEITPFRALSVIVAVTGSKPGIAASLDRGGWATNSSTIVCASPGKGGFAGFSATCFQPPPITAPRAWIVIFPPFTVAIRPSIRATGLSEMTGVAATAQTGRARKTAVRKVAPRIKGPYFRASVWNQMRPFQGAATAHGVAAET